MGQTTEDEKGDEELTGEEKQAGKKSRETEVFREDKSLDKKQGGMVGSD